MASSTLVSKIKTSLRITTNAFDSEISDLIDAAKLDLGIAGISTITDTDHLIIRAITTYCRMNFGDPEYYDRLKMSYDEQKSQLGMATGYTTWSASNGQV